MKLAVTALLKSIWRAALAFFLLYAAATPAMAELGCYEDVQSYELAPGVPAGMSISSPEEEGSLPQGAAKHCCVSHCAHAFVAKPSIGEGSISETGRLSYAPRLLSKPSSAPRDGPDHPPRI